MYLARVRLMSFSPRLRRRISPSLRGRMSPVLRRSGQHLRLKPCAGIQLKRKGAHGYHTIGAVRNLTVAECSIQDHSPLAKEEPDSRAVKARCPGFSCDVHRTSKVVTRRTSNRFDHHSCVFGAGSAVSWFLVDALITGGAIRCPMVFDFKTKTVSRWSRRTCMRSG